jgi:hypothetical protein
MCSSYVILNFNCGTIFCFDVCFKEFRNIQYFLINFLSGFLVIYILLLNIKHILQEEVQKDGGKSLDLVNHPYIFMVRNI